MSHANKIIPLTERQKAHFNHLKEEEIRKLAQNADLIDAFKQLCQKKGVILTDRNFKHVQTIGIVACYPNLVEYLCTDFSRDKEGLVDFNLLKSKFERQPFAKGFLYSDKFMLMAHPYFRREFHENSSFSPRFIEVFWSFNDPKIETFISLDYNRVRINVDNSACMEFDTWYGAQFKNDISEISDGVSKLKPPSDLDDFTNSFLFADAYSLDIKWETKNGIKSFQAEEFKTDKEKLISDGKELYPVRYIHAEFDISKNIFRHFDGAIHLYTQEEYYDRRDSDFNYNAKNSFKIKSASEKLFKMNGNVSVEDWIKFSSHFLTKNPLLIEYFEGKYPDEVSEILAAMQKAKENGD
ncbi:MAG: hypothetical protein JWQ09_5968 [Segetibacter sp.]|nr:hypothetical protein [Segetibacter sp.]